MTIEGTGASAGRGRSLDVLSGSASVSVLLLLLAALACSKGKPEPTPAGAQPAADAPAVAGGDTAVGGSTAGDLSKAGGPIASLPPNEMGEIPVLEYHIIQDRVFDEFERPPARFRQDLEELYKRGYRPVNVSDVVDRKIQSLPKGISPVVFTFDDAPPSQFSFLGSPDKIDPNSAIGMWLDFQKTHPGWGDKATFCLLPAASAGHAFFGDKGIAGQQTAWRFIKVKWLADHGFELCDHTLWHARLDKYPDAMVQQQLARGQLAIDSAVPGYQVRTMALPLGMWPKNRPLAWEGSWTDPKSGRTVRYHFDSVLEVSGNPNANPYLTGFDAHRIHRQIMTGNALEATLNRLDKPGPNSRYISDGDPKTVAKPVAEASAVLPARK